MLRSVVQRRDWLGSRGGRVLTGKNKPFCASTALGLLLLGLPGCPASKTPEPGGDPERMSVSEYDVARDTWLRQGRPREALAHALKSTELNEHNADALHLVALIYLDFCRRSPPDCRLTDAERYARAALDERSDYREARNTLGVILIHEKKPTQAVAVLEPLSRDILYQTPENAWGNLGWAYLEAGQVDKAIDALRRSVAVQPLFCVGQYRLGVAHELKGQPRLALEALDRALETNNPRCAGLQAAYAARARVHLKLGQREQAESDIRRCLELDPKSTDAQDCQSTKKKLE
ncbi:MAG: tetratricopeptide repeat protein [Polyangiaceae bacterium]|nr:tetratricopeptide repeat protein [Polyangiaceae bacterium]